MPLALGIGIGPVFGGAGLGSSFTPASLTPDVWGKADGTLWQDSARTTPVTANNDPIGAMDDLSGNGRHFTQATGATRPTNKTGQLNGLPSVQFDGVNDFLQTTGFAAADPFWLCLLIRQRTWTLSSNALDSVGGVRQLYMPTASPRLTMFESANGPTTTQLAVNAFGILEMLWNGASSYIAVNNNADITGNSGSSAATGLALAGKAAAITAIDVVEVVGVLRVPSAGERTSMRAYLNSRGAIF